MNQRGKYSFSVKSVFFVLFLGTILFASVLEAASACTLVPKGEFSVQGESWVGGSKADLIIQTNMTIRKLTPNFEVQWVYNASPSYFYADSSTYGTNTFLSMNGMYFAAERTNASSNASRIIAVNASDGNLLWDHTVAAGFKGLDGAGNRLCYSAQETSSSNGTVTCLNTNGSLLWSTEIDTWNSSNGMNDQVSIDIVVLESGDVFSVKSHFGGMDMTHVDLMHFDSSGSMDRAGDYVNEWASNTWTFLTKGSENHFFFATTDYLDMYKADVRHFDNTGAMLWNKTVPGEIDEVGYGGSKFFVLNSPNKTLSVLSSDGSSWANFTMANTSGTVSDLVVNDNKVFISKNSWDGFANNATTYALTHSGNPIWTYSFRGPEVGSCFEAEDGIIYLDSWNSTINELKLIGLVPPRIYVDGDIAPYSVPDGRLTADDALVALQCAIGKLETKANISVDGDVAPLDNSTGVLQPDPDGQVNVGDAVVLLKGSVGQYAWEGMALLNGQRYMANIVTDTSDVSNAFGYQFDLLIGNGGYDPASGLVNATGSLPSGSTLDGSYDDTTRTMTLGLMSTSALNATLPVATGLGTDRYLLLKFPLPENVVADSLNKIAIINDGDADNGFVDNLGAKITVPPIGRTFYLTNENI